MFIFVQIAERSVWEKRELDL